MATSFSAHGVKGISDVSLHGDINNSLGFTLKSHATFHADVRMTIYGLPDDVAEYLKAALDTAAEMMEEKA